jgi:hypothetical protein
MALNTPWAILKCKWNDIDDEPLSDDYVEKLFTTAGAGTLNMVDFFDTMSHGNLDLSGSQVFGWITLPNPETDSPAHVKITGDADVDAKAVMDARNWLVDLAVRTATTEYPSVKNFPYQVVLMNTRNGIQYGGGHAAVGDGGNAEPSGLGQEMGHAYGLKHSRRAGSLADYKDPWDIMSTYSAFMVEARLGPYGRHGPGLNAANMRGRGWLDRSRVLTLDSGKAGFPHTVQLRPLHARELPGYLALEIDDYIIEFRDPHKWDGAIGHPAVFVHSLSDDVSYIEQNKNRAEALHVGDSWDLGGGPDLPYTQVLVEGIDAANRTATLTLTHRAGRQFVQYVGGSFGIPWVDGGGFLGGSGRQSVPVEPRNELIDVIDHLVAFKSVENLRRGPARDAVQRAAMEQLVQYAEAQLGRLNAVNFGTPAALSLERTLERPS